MINEMTIGALFGPILIYLLVLGSFEAFSLTRLRTLARTFVWGLASALLALGCVWLWRYTHDGQTWSAWWASPLLEETLKALPLAILIYRGKIVFFAETQIYGQMIGGGFALVENIFFFLAAPDMMPGTALIRGFGTSLLHMGCTAFVASALLMAKNNSKKSRILLPAFCYMLPPVAIGFHILYDLHLLNPAYQLLVVVLVFFLIFILLAYWNDKIVSRWLELALNDDINLLSALREGRLLETKAGTYLQSIKDRFEPLVFFDMVAYLILYMELIIESKSRIMLNEAGIDIPRTESQKQEHDDKVEELHTLYSRIPKLGMALLQPLTQTNQQDLWALEE